MDGWSKVLPTNYLEQHFGGTKAAQVTDAFNHESEKFKKSDDQQEFRSSLEIHLTRELMGKEKADRFYLELQISYTFNIENRLQKFDEAVSSLQAPFVQNRNTPAISPCINQPAPLSTPQAQSSSTRIVATDSNDADSAGSSHQSDTLISLESMTWQNLPRSEVALRTPTRRENEKS